MTGWVPYVFVRVVVCFAAGILLGMYCPEALGEPLAMGLLAAGVVVYSVWFLAAQRFAWKPASLGWVALPLLILAGYLSLLLHTGSRRSDHFMGQEGAVDYYEAVLTQDPQVRETRYRAEARIIRIHAGHWREVSGNVLLYFAKDTAATTYHYGDVFLVRGRPQPVAAPANPGAFDYRRYLANRNIYHQQFLNTTAVRRVDHQSSLMDYAMTLRRWSAAVIQENIQGTREQATAMALVLGVTDALDDDLLQAYAATGAMHVLAVSGLHISVLYFVIAFIFRPLKHRRYGPWLLAAVSIFLLWGYAFVTALSPSVLRAVVMFTFMAIATATRRNTNDYNTLAAAAFCLLLVNPYLLLSVGFQLSFLAVAGIMYIHPLLFARWEPRQRWVSELWKVTSVSIAAQLATFPLGLLYFHQFPNYFLLSNLLAVPGSSVVLVGGLLLLAGSVLSPVAAAVGVALTWLIRVLNGVIFTFEKLPYSVVEDIHITLAQSVVLMLMVVLTVRWLTHRKFRYLKPVVAAGVVLSLLQWWHYTQEVCVSRLTVYAVPGHTAVDFIAYGQAVFYADTALYRDTRHTRFQIRPNRVQHGVRAIQRYPDDTNGRGYRFITSGGITLLHVWKKNASFPENIPCDYILVSHNAVTDLTVLRNPATPIILDSSNAYAYAQRMLQQSATLQMTVHSVPHAGAYDIDLKSRDHDETYYL
jgi:competence protein ComEC